MKVESIFGSSYTLFGIRAKELLVYPDISGMARWINKDNFKPLEGVPDYLVQDELVADQLVLPIYQSKFDLDFHFKGLKQNESNAPLYFAQKRMALALEAIYGKGQIRLPIHAFSNEAYFMQLAGKFETANEIIDTARREEEAHSMFEWFYTPQFEPSEDSQSIIRPIENFENKLIQLCEFVANKINTTEYSIHIFTDLYAAWKTFLLGHELQLLEKISKGYEQPFEHEYRWIMHNDTKQYIFNFQFYDC